MKKGFAELYEALLRSHGPQGWWPADDAFEMIIGAILTQRTAWRNAEQALIQLRSQGLIDAERMERMPRVRLAATIRPAGFFNVKAKRLKNFLRWYRVSGGYEALAKLPTEELRAALLSVAGIGPETADVVLVYAFRRPVFVVDAYARRILRRFGLISGTENYEEIRSRVERSLPGDSERLGELHALLVAHAKGSCRHRPLCDTCCLGAHCARDLET